MKEVSEFLQKCKTYYLATVEGDQPRVRPFGTAHIFEGKLYIQTGKTKSVAKQIATNPKVEISAFDGERWIRIEAKLVEDDRLEARVAMLEAYPQLKERYSPDDGNTVVYYLKDAVATINSFTAKPVVIKF
jgi:uncharacterized pyridoxamine 5'-phosphate oxidase family protein